MKQCWILLLIAAAACAGCRDIEETSDQAFKGIMSSPRYLERFHYAGTRKHYDYFVGEQWSMHTFGPSAKDTERYFKIKDSRFANERFPLTKDTQKWVLVKERPSNL